MFEFSKRTKKKIKNFLNTAVAVTSSFSIVLSSVSYSYAQSIIVDPSAPGTSFLQTGNGTPQIDIATPQSGVSLNQFSEFNVGADGLILNNSTSNGLSIIGANVTANPNLVSGPANVIVNEVTSAAPSSLTGTTEVFGQTAAVIIANPNGISCNGCDFLNSTSTSLTTGTSIITGSQIDLLVTKGTITIGPDGFDAGPQAGLFGRHVIINGPVTSGPAANGPVGATGQSTSNGLVVSGGAQRATLDFTQLDASGIVAAPSLTSKTSPFAIDASVAGTLTGGSVRIANPETGQGVNLYGAINTQSFAAQSAGDLFYKDITANGAVTLFGGNIRQYGDLNTDGSVVISGNSFTLYDGRVINTGSAVDITAAEFVVIAGEVSGGSIEIDVSTGSLTNTGFLLADGDLTIVAGEHVSQQRDIASEYDIYFDPALGQYLQAYQTQLLNGGAEADIAAEMIARASQHELIAEYIDKGATITGTNVTVTAGENITNTGGAIAATNDVLLTAGNNIINEYLALRSRLNAEDGCSDETCGYRTDFHAGEILAGNDLTLTTTTGNIENRASDIAAANNILLSAGQDVVNSLMTSNFEASETEAVQIIGPRLVSTWCGKDCTTYSVSSSEYTTNEYRFNEENILSPGRIATLYGNVAINAGRDFISIGSEISAGNDLSIDAVGQAILSSYIDAEEDFISRNERYASAGCSGGKYVTCGGFEGFTYVTYNDTVLATATSNLVGRSISITAGDNITLLGARFLASADLDLTSTNGSVLIESTALPSEVALGYSSDIQFIELTDDVVGQIFGVGDTQETEPNALGSQYVQFLQGNDLLTAVEGLRRATSGADIKDAARNVGVQSYVSLIASTHLDTLQADAAAAIYNLHATIGADIITHNNTVSNYHEDFRTQLKTLTDLLDLSDAEMALEVQSQIDALTAAYDTQVATIETDYQAQLAANQAQYGHLLTTQVRRSTTYCGKYCTTTYYWVTVTNTYYVDLKNTVDAQAEADRIAALDIVNTQNLIDIALVQSSSADEAINGQIATLSTDFGTQIDSYTAQKTVLFTSLNTQVTEAMRVAELVVQQQVLEESIRATALAKDSVVEGERSLAVALTKDAFPELDRVRDLSVNDDGLVQNTRDGTEEATRTVTETRDVGEYQEQVSIVSVPHTSGYWGGKDSNIWYSTTTYTDVEVTEDVWVVTGTEDYQVEETYIIQETNPLMPGTKEEQDKFINATAWRFASANGLASTPTSPKNLILSQGDLTLYSQGDILLNDAALIATNKIGLSSFGNIGAARTTLKGNTVGSVAAGSFTGLGLAIDAQTDASIFAGEAVNIRSLGTAVTVANISDNIAGTLSQKDWGIAVGQSVTSQELSTVIAGRDLSIVALSDVTLEGVTGQVGGDVLISADGNINLSAIQSVIEHHTGGAGNGTDLYDVRSHVTDFTVGGNFKALAKDSATLEGTQIDAAGAIELAALNNLILSAAQDIYDYEVRTYSSSLLSSRSTLNSETRVTNKGVNLTATQNVDIVAELGDLTTAGARLESREGDVNISAVQGDILAGTYTDIDQTRSEYESSSFFGFFGSTRNYATDNRFVTGTAALAAVDLTLVSGADTELVGAYLSAGHDLNLNVGGDLRVLAAISSEREDFFESKLGAVVATTETERSFKESAVYTTFLSGGGLAINVGGETQLTLYNYEDETAPSVADVYPEELLALANLLLLNDELADEYFYDKTTTLSPAFIALLTIVVTMGVGQLLAANVSSLVATAAVPATATTAAIPATLTVTGQATAAFAASAIVGSTNGVVSGDFDLGDILKNAAFSAATSYLASSINLKAAGDTAGATEEIIKANELTGVAKALDKKFSVLGGSWGDGFNTGLLGGEQLTAANVLERAFDGAISSGLSSAVYGTDFKTGLRNSVIRNVVALGLADVQAKIGGVFNDANGDSINGGEGSFGHIALHAIAGCAAAEASGADCGAGAAGAVVQAVYSGSLSGTGLSDEQQIKRAQLYGSLAGYIFSGGKGENVGIASSIAASGIANNRQLHRSEAELLAELQTGKSDEEKLRLKAAACFIINCLAGVPESDLQYAAVKALYDNGAGYQAEQQQIRDASTGEIFVYSSYDQANDLVSREDESVSRVIGAGQAIAGSAQAAGGIVLGVGGCGATLGVACVVTLGVGSFLVVDGYFIAADGTEQLFGHYIASQGQGVLDSLDLANHDRLGIYDPIKDAGRSAGFVLLTAAAGGVVTVAGKRVIQLADNIGELAANGTKLWKKATDFNWSSARFFTPKGITLNDLGTKIGSGGVKDIYAYGDDKVVGLVQPGKNVDSLTSELATLKELDELGFPTVNARRVEVDGQPGLLMDRFELGSKDVVRTINGTPTIVGDSLLLNQRSIDDLNNIKQMLRDRNVKVNDLQFLIGKDGQVVIADPIAITTGTTPSNVNIKTINRLIEVAMENL